jgi:hypothetical protein
MCKYIAKVTTRIDPRAVEERIIFHSDTRGYNVIRISNLGKIETGSGLAEEDYASLLRGHILATIKCQS